MNVFFFIRSNLLSRGFFDILVNTSLQNMPKRPQLTFVLIPSTNIEINTFQ